MKPSEKPSNRREFLKLAGAGAPAVVLSATAGSAEADEAAEAGTGLRKTEHVKKYLETARF